MNSREKLKKFVTEKFNRLTNSGKDPMIINKNYHGFMQKLDQPDSLISKKEIDNLSAILGIEKGSDEWFEYYDLATNCLKELTSMNYRDDFYSNQMPILVDEDKIEKENKPILFKIVEYLKKLNK